jgi:dipeptidyl aminopeptidase/acylaminoacyl peptidase
MKIRFMLLAMLLTAPSWAQGPVGKRPLQPADVYRILSVSDPRVSPEEEWIAYVLSRVDSAKNQSNQDIWMISRDGGQSIRHTYTPEGESQPRWSPDGAYLAFLSARQKSSQVWLLDRRGGEARKLTEVKGDLEDYVWSPDGKQLALVIKDAEPADTSSVKVAKPIVIDRVHFKEDREGYLQNRRSHLYQFTLASSRLDTLTAGPYDDSSPAWSPDGTQIVFVSNRTADPDRNGNSDLWIIDSKPGATVRRLTSWKGPDYSPTWNPDGASIAYLQSSSAESWPMYGQALLAIIPVQGGTPRLLTRSLDRPASSPCWSRNGSTLAALIEDDRESYMAVFDSRTGELRSSIRGQRSISSIVAGPSSSWISLISTPQLANEVFAIDVEHVRRLTFHQDSLFNRLALAEVEPFTSRSLDGTQVSGMLYRLPERKTAGPLPLIVWMHGGPVGQDEWQFDLTRQMLAASGYAVAAVNYRGSSGRGQDFCRAIYADWGNKEVVDILGAVDHLVKTGIADPQHLGIGGWSYGGILTDATIARDGRFTAAVSGAGSALQFSLFGVDQYIVQWENEVGWPWKNPSKYMRLSAPFFSVDKIKTPTLFLAGEKDFNVPIAGSEQMYQALRVLGVPTQLVVYPGQFHMIGAPRYRQDLYERFLAWFKKYL